jgi:hypothetical protein
MAYAHTDVELWAEEEAAAKSLEAAQVMSGHLQDIALSGRQGAAPVDLCV